MIARDDREPEREQRQHVERAQAQQRQRGVAMRKQSASRPSTHRLSLVREP